MAEYNKKELYNDNLIELITTNKINHKKYIPFIFVALLSFVLGIWYLYSGKSLKDDSIEAGLISKDYFVDLNDFTVTMLSSSGKNNYLRTSFAIHLSNESDIAFIENKMPMIKDALQVFLREIRPADINYSGGLLRIKEESIKRINKIVTPIIIKDILFKEIMVN